MFCNRCVVKATNCPDGMYPPYIATNRSNRNLNYMGISSQGSQAAIETSSKNLGSGYMYWH